MDTVGAMLAQELSRIGAVEVEQVAPPIRPITPDANANKLLLRFFDYPRWLARNRHRFDLFHIVDHSYSQLAHVLPREKTIITCHDIDTFRSVLEPERDPRNVLFRAMTRRILSGFRRAAHVACDSSATLAELERHCVLPCDRMSVVPLGAHRSCSPHPNPAADREALRLLGPASPFSVELLHVGSTIARKRIDVLLRIVSELSHSGVALRLIRVGGPLSPAQRALARELDLEPLVAELPFLDRDVLSAVYRRAALVLQPSDSEGFGLPVAEAMACGTPVVVSDLAVLREVGGGAAVYCRAGAIPEWVGTIRELLRLRNECPHEWEGKIMACLQQASRFTWSRYAETMLDVYNRNLTVEKNTS